MSPTVLPPNPSIEHLKKQAKDLFKSYQNGDVSVCTLLKQHLPRFVNLSNQEIFADKFTLHDAQYVIARHYGFEKWSDLREAVQMQTMQNASVFTLNQVDEKQRLHIDALGFSTLSAYRIWCHKQGFDGGLDKDDVQLELERERRLEMPPEPVQDHRRGQAERFGVFMNGWIQQDG